LAYKIVTRLPENLCFRHRPQNRETPGRRLPDHPIRPTCVSSSTLFEVL
jgi:hypothetical protein